MNKPFNLILVSAFHEQGGNVLLRFLDGHRQLMAYPFESTMATPLSTNLIAGPNHWMPQRYAYPAFDSETTPEQAYHQMIDHELKTYLRSPHASKFRDCGLVMDEAKRIERFKELHTLPPLEEWEQRTHAEGVTWEIDHPFLDSSRAGYIEAFFRATMDTWSNRVVTGEETHYVGYIPPVLMDADRFFADFPEGHMIHITRNPFSGYADTIKRPFPFPVERYCQMWSVCAMQAKVYELKYLGHFHTIRYEDLVADPTATMNDLCAKIGLKPFADTPRPTFNRAPLDTVYPWGTIRHATTEANEATARELTSTQARAVWLECRPMVNEWGYAALAAELCGDEQ